MNGLRVRNAKGITLIELLVAISIAAILLTVAVPSFQEIRKNSQVASQSNVLIALIHLAKSQALRINDDVELQVGQSSNGWWGYVRLPPAAAEDVPPPDCPNIDGIVRCAEGASVELETGSSDGVLTVVFNNRGFLAEAGNWPQGATINLKHQACRGERQHRRIDILPTGQVSACSLACDETSCP